MRDMPDGNDYFVVADVAALRRHPMAQAMMVMMSSAMPPEFKQLIESLSVLEVQANLVSRGPVSISAHFSDDASAKRRRRSWNSERQTL